MDLCVTVDLEHDCPPFLTTYRGVTEGMPRLLDCLAGEAIPTTFFCTGDVARKHPEIVRRLVAEGHELGCHGDTHARFGGLDPIAAAREIGDAARTLRAFAPVTSFRAPNLDFPVEYVALLEEHGFTLDSSQGRHKPGSFFMTPSTLGAVRRVPATMAPSALRLPAPVRNLLCGRMRDPVVFFFHPWEFVDMTKTPIPLDCRFRTGQPAIDALVATVRYFRKRGATLKRMRELVPVAVPAAA